MVVKMERMSSTLLSSDIFVRTPISVKGKKSGNKRIGKRERNVVNYDNELGTICFHPLGPPLFLSFVWQCLWEVSGCSGGVYRG